MVSEMKITNADGVDITECADPDLRRGPWPNAPLRAENVVALGVGGRAHQGFSESHSARR